MISTPAEEADQAGGIRTGESRPTRPLAGTELRIAAARIVRTETPRLTLSQTENRVRPSIPAVELKARQPRNRGDRHGASNIPFRRAPPPLELHSDRSSSSCGTSRPTCSHTDGPCRETTRPSGPAPRASAAKRARHRSTRGPSRRRVRKSVHVETGESSFPL